MHKRNILACLIMACILLISGCSAKPDSSKTAPAASSSAESLSVDPSQPDTLALPDRIVYFNKGSEQTFKKGDPVYGKLYTLTQKRVTKDLDQAVTDIASGSDLCGMVRVLKFEYSSKQTIHPKGKDLLSEVYQTLYFPLECTPKEPMLSRYVLDDVDRSDKTLGPLDDPTLTLQYVIMNLDPANPSSPASGASEAVTIPKPDGIVYYDHGKAQSLQPGDKLFNQVYNIAVKRFESVSGLRNTSLQAPAETSLESSCRVLEFNYNAGQTLTVSGAEISFKKLVFPLEKTAEGVDLTNNFLYDGGTNPVAFIPSPDELIYFLKENFK